MSIELFVRIEYNKIIRNKQNKLKEETKMNKNLENEVKRMQEKGWELRKTDLGTQRKTELFRSGKEICIEHIRGQFDNYYISVGELREFDKAVELFEMNAPIVDEIKNMSTIQQTNLRGIDEKIFLLICNER